MIIIVGLGNPGEKFKNTRHNVGFMAVDFFARKNDFPEFEFSKKYDSLVSKKNMIMLAKPKTFMNESGKAVKKIISKNKKGDLVVVHDDIDIKLKKLKIVKKRGSAGHKGVESVIKNIGNEELIRLRIGIQPDKGKPKNPKNFVIKKISGEEKEILNSAITKASDALDYFIENGLEKTINKYN